MRAPRRSLLEALRRDEVHDLVVITGDLHTSWATEVTMPTFTTGQDQRAFALPR